MPESKLLNTRSQVTINGVDVSVLTYYFVDELPNTLDAFIADILSNLEGVDYKEGELIIVVKNYPGSLNWFLNSNGDLNIDAADASQYSINSNGELIYNTV